MRTGRLVLSALSAIAFGVQAVTPAAAQNAGLEDQIAATLTTRFANGGRYVIGTETPQTPHRHCSAIPAGDPKLSNPLIAPYAGLVGSANAKLLECDYPFPQSSARRGWVIVVAATPKNLAKRIVGACAEVAPTAAADCSKLMLSAEYKYPWGSNNFIYPVTGFVREPCGGGENLLGFRHGVTIQYGKSPTDKAKMDYCVTGNKPIDWQKSVGLTHTTHEVFKIGRIAAVSRLTIPAEGDFSNNSPAGLEPDNFQAYVRANEIRAVETGYDRLMVIKAAQVMGLPVPPPH